MYLVNHIGYTVIRFYFVVKIFSYQENGREYYNFTAKIFLRWLAPCYTEALPQLLLPIYLCIPGSLLTQQTISFSQAISLACGVISSINTHHMCLEKLFSSNLVCENYFAQIFFGRKFTTHTKKSELW